MKYAYLVLILLFLSIRSLSQDSSSVVDLITPEWIYLCSSVDNAKIYMRSEYVQKTVSTIKVWIKDTRPTTVIDKKVYKNVTEVALYEINCYSKKFNIAQVTTYNSKGLVIKSYTFDVEEWHFVLPETTSETIVEKVCKTFN